MREKKILIRIGVLTAVFIVAVIIISLITNRGTEDRTADMGAATLPRISFNIEGHTVNDVVGYVDEMDITAMRDAITPIANDGTITMKLEKYGNTINQINYEIYTLTGEETLAKGTGEEVEDVVTLNLRDVLTDVSEAMMKVTLLVGDKNVYYYMRVEKPDNLSTKACLDFSGDFHNNTFNRDAQSWVEGYIESDAEAVDNTTFQTVTIQSDIEQIMWGTLNPQVIGDVRWSIKESNSTYTSILGEYQVSVTTDDVTEAYNIKEFFRIRISESTIYLLNYNRTMNQVFNGKTNQVLSDKGIILGITDAGIDYETNKKGTIVSFVQERDLWTYNQEKDQLSLVFSFSNTEGSDARNNYDQHDIRIISVDADGSTTFAVYGYMNRGNHEGQVGVDVFYYDLPKNSVEEKAFIPTDQSFALAEEELGKLVYYNHDKELLYVLTGGVLYRVELTDKKQEELAKGLVEGQYIASDDGHLVAYQNNGQLDTATSLTVLNLNTSDEQVINVSEGQCVKPLGFVAGDVIYGIANVSDKGSVASGDIILPMYTLEIRDKTNTVVKTYNVDQIYIEDVFVKDNMITLNRVTKSGEIYTGIAPDYITNNEEKTQSNITIESFVTDKMETEYRLIFEAGISDQAPKLLQPRQVAASDAPEIAFAAKDQSLKFLVFGTGEVAGIYDKASYAIASADALCGVVISTNQQYVWERGNRDLSFQTGFAAFGIPEGMTSLQACEQQLENFGGTRIDLTGCAISQVCYIINKGIPVIAMTDANTAILLTGYTESTVTYINPVSGEELTVSEDEMTNMVAGSGNAFIGYVK